MIWNNEEIIEKMFVLHLPQFTYYFFDIRTACRLQARKGRQ